MSKVLNHNSGRHKIGNIKRSLVLLITMMFITSFGLVTGIAAAESNTAGFGSGSAPANSIPVDDNSNSNVIYAQGSTTPIKVVPGKTVLPDGTYVTAPTPAKDVTKCVNQALTTAFKSVKSKLEKDTSAMNNLKGMCDTTQTVQISTTQYKGKYPPESILGGGSNTNAQPDQTESGQYSFYQINIHTWWTSAYGSNVWGTELETAFLQGQIPTSWVQYIFGTNGLGYWAFSEVNPGQSSPLIGLECYQVEGFAQYSGQCEWSPTETDPAMWISGYNSPNSHWVQADYNFSETFSYDGVTGSFYHNDGIKGYPLGNWTAYSG